MSWPTSEAEVGPNFSLKISFHGTPVPGTRISLISALSKDGGVAAAARTNSHGVVRFKTIAPGAYGLDSPDGVLFPSGQILIVKAGHAPAKKVELDWPTDSIASRNLRGKFTVSEQLNAPEIPLRNAVLELLNVYSAKLIEAVSTDANGEYEFATKDSGLYSVRLVLPKKGEAGVEKRDLAVELDPEAREFSLPEMKVTQSHCAGIQLFQRSTKDDRWEEQ